MTLLIQKNQAGSNISGEMQRNAKDWVTASNFGSERLLAGESEASLANNLPLVTKRVEQLIDALEMEIPMMVSVSYMRIETSALFHVLLLISREDFLSPKIQAARTLAERTRKLNATYEVRFSFAIDSENMMENGIKFNGFRLMNIRHSGNNIN